MQDGHLSDLIILAITQLKGKWLSFQKFLVERLLCARLYGNEEAK
jgi:hypothetical protein